MSKGIAIVGCGYVADYYVDTLGRYPELEVVGVTDLDRQRVRRLAGLHGFHEFRSTEEAINDSRVEVVVNLTNPASHFEITRAALLAGKHVYSEKPLAMELAEATELVELAEQHSLLLSSAPCSLLGETAQTVWQAVRAGRVGRVRLVYAELDEGMVHQYPFKYWKSASGFPWPFRDEFEVGTVLEHAGYVLTWLPAMFGPAVSVTGTSECLIDVKAGVRTDGTDLSVAIIRFESGVIARVTCSLIAPRDHSLNVVGDEGVLTVADHWFYDSAVRARRSINIQRKHLWLPGRRVKPAGPRQKYKRKGDQNMDFARGIVDLARAIDEGRLPHLSARYCLHATELVLALNTELRKSSTYTMTTSCDPPELSWWHG
jgi:predicted dehydrogenase